MAQISFYGAAETVTGSKYLLEANGSRALIDCGIFQGLKRLRQLNWEPLPFAAAGVQNVVLTHAHADHCGYLPRLVKQGFHGKIFCTPATRRLAELILLDAAVNQQRDAKYAQLKGPGCVLTGPNVHLVRTVAESKALNDLTGPAVIISSSGMMVGGRILYHLRRRLPDPRASIILGGFMAAGTRGRQLQDGAETLRIHGHNVPVRAAVERVTGLSGHADRSDLLRWLAPLPPPRQVFLTHGEPESAAALADTLRKDRGWNVTVPRLGDQFSLDGDPPEAPNHATEDPQ